MFIHNPLGWTRVPESTKYHLIFLLPVSDTVQAMYRRRWDSSPICNESNWTATALSVSIPNGIGVHDLERMSCTHGSREGQISYIRCQTVLPALTLGKVL